MPKLLADKRLPFTRYWIQRGSEGKDISKRPYLIDGILPAPDEFGRAANSDLQTLDTIEGKRCFALLGQPGLGKSIVVEQWVETRREQADPNDLVLLLHGRGLASADEIWRVTVDAPTWRQARKRGGDVTLIIDGLDEALQRLPIIIHTLCNCLENEPVDRTRVVLVSRVADWREGRSEKLFARWPETDRGGAFELCPLTWEDVRLTAKESKTDPEQFIRAVHQRRVIWMAGRPKLLGMLLDEFRQHRKLPDSRRELFRRAATRMCAEHDPERHEILERSNRPVVPAERIYHVVTKIAALLLLSGKSHVALPETAPLSETSLPFADILDETKSIEDVSLKVDRTHTLAALDSSHFVPNGSSQLGFDHQSMAEFMAAEYLCNCTAPQLRSLLVQRIDNTDYLLPQFREVSAWLAVQHDEFREFLLQREPRFLLEADAVELDIKIRRDAVSKLLELMDHEEAFDGLADENFLQSIQHPQLAQQLRPYIVDENRNVVVRRTAIRFAGAAFCKALKPDLWKLLKQPQQISVRRAAVHALGKMAGPEDKQKFLQALSGAFGKDDEDELHGEALEFLVPRHLPVRSVLKHVVPHNERFYGSYWHVVNQHLPDSVCSADVLPVLRECLKQTKFGGHLGPLQKIAAAATKLAFKNFGDLVTRRTCVSFLAAWMDHHGWQDTWEQFKPIALTGQMETKLRRAIIEEFVKLAARHAVKSWRFHLWPEPSDMGWVLNRLWSAKTAAQRDVWADYISRLCFQPIASPFRKELQRAYNHFSVLRSKLPRPRRHDFFQTLERRARAAERWRELWERRQKRRSEKRAQNQLTVDKVLDHFRQGHAYAWPFFVQELRRESAESSSRKDENTTRSPNVALWPSWVALSIADQRLARSMSAKFLQEAPVPKRKLGKLFWNDGAAVNAIVLLHKTIAADANLRAVIRKKWVLAILHGLFSDESELMMAASLAYRLDRQSCLDWARKELIYQDKKSSGHTSLNRFKRCWDKGLTKVATTYVTKAKFPSIIVHIFALLVKLDPEHAESFCGKAFQSIGRKSTKRGRMIAFLGLVAFPKQGWSKVAASLKRSSRSTQSRFFTDHIGLVRYTFHNWPTMLTDHQLADLYLLLVDLFPPRSLQEYSDDGVVGTDSHISDWQKACMNTLIQRGTAESCEEIGRISQTVPPEDRIWVRWKLQEAVDQRLRTEWVRDQPATQTILRLARTATALWVRDEGELQEAILASLDRLQAAMHKGPHPEVLEFWREPGKKPVEEVEVSRLVSKWLERDLRDAGMVTDREPQIGRSGRIDLKIEIPSNRSTRRPRLVNIVEVKLCSHRHVDTACSTQLAVGYLQRNNFAHGIYLVAWFGLATSRMKWRTHEAAQQDCAGWAKAASISPQEVRGFVLDCRWREMESPNSLAR